MVVCDFYFSLFLSRIFTGKFTPKWPGPSTLRDLRVRGCSSSSFLDNFDSSSPRRESRRLKSRRGKVCRFPPFPAQCSIIHPKRGRFGAKRTPRPKMRKPENLSADVSLRALRGQHRAQKWGLGFHFFVEDFYWENAPQNGPFQTLCEICVFGNAHFGHFDHF